MNAKGIHTCLLVCSLALFASHCSQPVEDAVQQRVQSLKSSAEDEVRTAYENAVRRLDELGESEAEQDAAESRNDRSRIEFSGDGESDHTSESLGADEAGASSASSGTIDTGEWNLTSESNGTEESVATNESSGTNEEITASGSDSPGDGGVSGVSQGVSGTDPLGGSFSQSESSSASTPGFSSVVLTSPTPLVYSLARPATPSGAALNQPVTALNTGLRSLGVRIGSVSATSLACSGCEAPPTVSPQLQSEVGTIPDPTDATAGGDVLPLAVSYSGNGLIGPACRTLWDYAAFDCLLTGFSIVRNQLLSGLLGIEAYDSEQASFERLSNTLPTTKLIFKRLSNWAGSAEDVRAIRAVGSGSSARLVFEGRTVDAKQPQIFTYAISTGKVERLTWGSPFNVNTQNPSIIAIGNKVYGRIQTPTRAFKGYMYDFDAATVRILTNTAENDNISDSVFTFNSFSGQIFFVANNPNQRRKIYFYDENLDQIWQLMDRNGPNSHDTASNTASYPVVNGTMYFVAEAGAGNPKVFSFSGSEVTQVTDLVSNGSDDPTLLTAWGSRLCFAALAAPAIRKLYCYDPSSPTLTQVSDAAGTGVSDDITRLVADGSQALYYVADVSAGIKKIFRYDGSSNRRLGDTSGSPSRTDNPNSLFVHQGKLYFSALAPEGYALYEYNPAAQTLTRVFRTLFQDAATAPVPLASYNGKLYFSALKAQGVRKLYMFDGSATFQVSDTNPTGSDDPRHLTVFGDTLYFSSRSSAGTFDFNLWALCDLSTTCQL